VAAAALVGVIEQAKAEIKIKIKGIRSIKQGVLNFWVKPECNPCIVSL